MTDNINHPKHYEGHTSLECIDVMELAFGAEAVVHFCLCNAFKYLWRYKHKNGLEDVRKAKWYLKRIDCREDFLPDSIHEQYLKLEDMCREAMEELNEVCGG